jgi:hypothetical protein
LQKAEIRGGFRLSAPLEDISCLVLPVDCAALDAFRRTEMKTSHPILGPHVTLLGALRPREVTDAAVERLSAITASFPAIPCTFSQFGVFPDASFLHLSPYPITPLESLHRLILEALPDHQPDFTEPIFHLSVACGFDLPSLPALMDRAHTQLDAHLPLRTTLRQLCLRDRVSGVWRTRQIFVLKN